MVQTDNGLEFTNALLSDGKLSKFEQYLKQEKIEYKRIRPATPRHNGKAERAHRMDSERDSMNMFLLAKRCKRSITIISEMG